MGPESVSLVPMKAWWGDSRQEWCLCWPYLTCGLHQILHSILLPAHTSLYFCFFALNNAYVPYVSIGKMQDSNIVNFEAVFKFPLNIFLSNLYPFQVWFILFVISRFIFSLNKIVCPRYVNFSWLFISLSSIKICVPGTLLVALVFDIFSLNPAFSLSITSPLNISQFFPIFVY